MKRAFRIVLERGSKSYGAYVLELPGCVAVAKTPKETLELMKEAIKLHLEDLSDGMAGAAVPRKK